MKKYRFVRVRVHCIKNNFFGGNVTVTGLLTGQDIAAQAAGQMLSHRLLLPGTTLRSEQDILLDDMSVEELGARLGARVTVIPQDGAAFARAALGLPPAEIDSALRVSLSRDNDEEDIDRFLAGVEEARAVLIRR